MALTTPIRIHFIVATTAQFATDDFDTRAGFNTTIGAWRVKVGGLERVCAMRDAPQTFVGLQTFSAGVVDTTLTASLPLASNASKRVVTMTASAFRAMIGVTAVAGTSGQVALISASGVTSDAGLTYGQISGVTRRLALGDGAVAGPALFQANAIAGQNAEYALLSSGYTLWKTMRAASSNHYRIANFADTVLLDYPVVIVDGLGGAITLGGVATPRPVGLTSTLTVAALTGGRVPTVGAAGLVQTDAGFLYTATGGITRSITLGDGSVAGNTGLNIVRTPTYAAVISWGDSGGAVRWQATMDGTYTYRLAAYTSAAALIDYPLDMVNASAGLITIGGSTNRPTNHTGALQIAGSQFLSTGKALSVVSAQVTALGGGGVTNPVVADISGNLAAQNAATFRNTIGVAYSNASLVTVMNILTTPPGSPVTGDTYYVRGVATGAWVGRENQVATWSGVAWIYVTYPFGTTLYLDSYHGTVFSWATVSEPLGALQSNQFWTSDLIVNGTGNFADRVRIHSPLTGDAEMDATVLAIQGSSGVPFMMAQNDAGTKKGLSLAIDAGGNVRVRQGTRGALADKLTLLEAGGLEVLKDSTTERLHGNLCTAYTQPTITYTTAGSLIGTVAGSTTIGAGRLNALGNGIRIRAKGHYTTDATPGTATLDLTLSGGYFRTTGTFTLDASVTNGYWEVDVCITCIATGASGQLIGQMGWKHMQSTGAGAEVMHNQPATSRAAYTTDLTVAKTVDLFLSVSDPGTSFTCTDFTIDTMR